MEGSLEDIMVLSPTLLSLEHSSLIFSLSGSRNPPALFFMHYYQLSEAMIIVINISFIYFTKVLVIIRI